MLALNAVVTLATLPEAARLQFCAQLSTVTVKPLPAPAEVRLSGYGAHVSWRYGAKLVEFSVFTDGNLTLRAEDNNCGSLVEIGGGLNAHLQWLMNLPRKKTIWFTADLHFGHRNIIKYCRRPWSNVEEMDEALITNWNTVVKPDDEVWNLGDVAHCCTPSYAQYCLQQLNGKHHLVLGNHDDSISKTIFASVNGGYQEIEVDDQKMVLCHYAMREWHHALRGVWHLYGHTHAALRPFGKSVDVGVDNAAEVLGLAAGAPGAPATYRPISFEELQRFMSTQAIGPHPEFANFSGASA
jgi:calcineurin-like phosphoesterase family protein